ncbi:MAG TPA: serine protease [Puia sp.]
MQEITMLDAIERYIRGEMLPEERVYFEQMRKSNPAVDQMVVEHTIFLHQMSQYGEIKDFKSQLNEIHNTLSTAGEIRETPAAKVVVLWKKYKRVVGVAASIAGITALGISGLVSYLSPKGPNEKLIELSRELHNTQLKLNSVSNKINEGSVNQATAAFKSGGTGFLIDGNGYLVTNYHVVKNATLVEVQNRQGASFKARVLHLDPTADLAFLKIEDTTFKAYGPLPYGISRTGTKLGDDLFTMGYPRDEIVYGKGYMSARTGFQGDTLSYQITVAANPGNSGGPVLNKDGEVVGIVSSSQHDVQGAVFAIRTKNIFRALDDMRSDSTVLKSDSLFNHVRVPLSSPIKGMERQQQIEKIEDCIFIVKSNL